MQVLRCGGAQPPNSKQKAHLDVRCVIADNYAIAQNTGQQAVLLSQASRMPVIRKKYTHPLKSCYEGLR
jgi:hypothetical protein